MIEHSNFSILLVEDDKNAGFLLKQQLTKRGYQVSLCTDGLQGLEKFKSGSFDLCILDIMLPTMDGLTIGKKIRETNDKIPIIFLTARNLKTDMITGYTVGCDDYIIKPYDMDELMFKLNAMLKRSASNSIPEEKELEVGKLKLVLDQRLLSSPQKEITLSQKECRLISLFFRNYNEVVPRSLLLKEAWGNDDFFTSKSLDVYLVKVRRVLKMDPDLKLLNIHGFGYRLFSQS